MIEADREQEREKRGAQFGDRREQGKGSADERAAGQKAQGKQAASKFTGQKAIEARL